MIWLAYTAIAIVGALTLLAIYVNIYDDYDVSDRLRAAGALTRRVMWVLSLPLGLPVGALASTPMEAAFGCGEAREPCAVFVDWNLRFATIVAQIVLLRWLVARYR